MPGKICSRQNNRLPTSLYKRGYLLFSSILNERFALKAAAKIDIFFEWQKYCRRFIEKYMKKTPPSLVRISRSVPSYGGQSKAKAEAEAKECICTAAY